MATLSDWSIDSIQSHTKCQKGALWLFVVVETEKPALKFAWKCEGSRIDQTTLEKRHKVGGLKWPGFKTACRVTVPKPPWCGHEGGQVEHWNRMENPEIDPHIRGQHIFVWQQCKCNSVEDSSSQPKVNWKGSALLGSGGCWGEAGRAEGQKPMTGDHLCGLVSTRATYSWVYVEARECRSARDWEVCTEQVRNSKQDWRLT